MEENSQMTSCCQAFLSRSNKVCGKPVVPGKHMCAGHGGLSTGPRTEAGKARIAAAKTIHGRETRSIRTLRSQISAELRRVEEEMYAEGLIHGPRIRGRKPTAYLKQMNRDA